MEELKRCPFCGGEAEMHYGIFTDDAYVECIECKARSHVFFENNSAIVAWNRRVTQNIGKADICRECELSQKVQQLEQEGTRLASRIKDVLDNIEALEQGVEVEEESE